MFYRPFIIDLESTNETHVNDEAIPTSRYYELKMGDGMYFFIALPILYYSLLYPSYSFDVFEQSLTYTPTFFSSNPNPTVTT